MPCCAQMARRRYRAALISYAGGSPAVLRADPVHGDACLDKQIGIFVGVG